MSQNAVETQETINEEAVIRTLIDAWADSFRNKNIDKMLSHYAQDMVFFGLAPPLKQAGADTFKKSLENWFPGFEGPIGYELTDLKIVVNGNAAFAHSVNHMTGKRKEGEFGVWIRSTLGFHKIDGKWLITHEHLSVPFYMEGSFKAAVDLKP